MKLNCDIRSPYSPRLPLFAKRRLKRFSLKLSQFFVNSYPEYTTMSYPLLIIVKSFLADLFVRIFRAVTHLLFRRNGSTAVKSPSTKKIIPLSVNFHFTRECNYECGFCFHTAKTSHLTPLEDAKSGLKKLADAGMKKINFSGGEPFLRHKYLGQLCEYCKTVLKLESVTIVSNGSKIRENFFKTFGTFVDILAISVDSFDEETNTKIGRGKGRHLEQLLRISEWCAKYEVLFKLNSVINRYNHEEDFVKNIEQLAPVRWKCFQVLQVDTENNGGSSLRDCSKFLISDEEYDQFCARHKHLKCFVKESNRMMRSSYLILDEYMRFLNKGDVYGETPSILDVPLEEALNQTDWEPEVFLERGGIYDWTKKPSCVATTQNCSKLSW